MRNVSWLDVKLGLRIFAKYPGLSLVSVVGLAVAIAVGAGYFIAFGVPLDSTLPFDHDNRMVVIRTTNVRGPVAGSEGLSTAYDFERWGQELKSVANLGAFREDSRNLITSDGRAYPVRVASMTASGFAVTGVAPVMGRTLLPADERATATRVIVIGSEEWQRRFNSDPAILGRVVRLDETPHTVVGVMPEGFGFPINHHYWVPLRTAELDRSAGGAGTLTVFGRLTAGYSLEDARTELRTTGERLAAALPRTHKDLRTQVQPYARAFGGPDGPGAELAVRSLQFGVSLLLLVVAVNVSILVYARTATRSGEIAVRTALGASRARVVMQLFVEALLPALAAAAIGLGVLSIALRPFREYLRHSPDADGPYWISPEALDVSRGVVFYAIVLAIVAAAIIGILPALKATDRRVQARLQQFSFRGAGLRLGRTWTALIVLQVAVAVAALPPALYKAEHAYRVGVRTPSSAATPLLRATLEMSNGGRTPQSMLSDDAAAQFAARMQTWIERVGAEPGVAAVTFAEQFPGDERLATVEADFETSQAVSFRAQPNRVATNLFDILGVRVLTGRGFSSSDASGGARTIVVDQIFAQRLGGGSVLGRRVRFPDGAAAGTGDGNRWYEIVGVVPAFTAALVPPVGFRDPLPRVYFAGAAGDSQPATVIVQVTSGNPTRLSQRLSDITAAVHPALKLVQPVGVVEEIDRDRQVLRAISLALIAVTGSVLLLSAAGIYAMMSFTVAKRRREIGIRAALGADARRVLLGIFGRSAAQIGAGIGGGLAIAAALERLSGGDAMGGQGYVLLPAVAGIMFTVGVLAALGPARRGLAVEPTEALREE